MHYIGVCATGPFLSRDGNIVAMLDYVAKRFEVVHVAIGTNVDYAPGAYDGQMRKAPTPGPARARWKHLWPEGSLPDPRMERPENRLSLARTNRPLFTVGLVQWEYSGDDIQKISSGNVLPVLVVCGRSTVILSSDSESRHDSFRVPRRLDPGRAMVTRLQ